MTPITFLVWFFGIPAALALAMVVVPPILELISWRAENAATQLQAHLTGWREGAALRSSHEQEHEKFLRWLSAKAGTGPMAGAVDEPLVEAQKQSELIRFLVDEELPRTISRCLRTHQVMARASGVSHMSQIAYETETYGQRAQVVWLLTHTIEFLEQYPLRLDDPHLLENSIVLRKSALPTCRCCPYVQCAVDQLPPLCPTAQLFQPTRDKRAC